MNILVKVYKGIHSSTHRMNTFLHDGLNRVNTIAVLLWYRNNESYIKNYVNGFFSRVEKLYSDVTFKYYIMENDSTDNTRHELEQFMKDRQGLLITTDLNCSNETTGISYTRIQRMAMVRRYLLDKVRDHLIECDWVFCLDSDVYADELNIKHMMDTKPRKNNIGMVTTNSVIVHCPPEQTLSIDNPPLTLLHYYDTFAFVAKDDSWHYPHCASSQCISDRCRSAVPMRIDFSKDVEVRSAWGGCVLIDASVFKDPRVTWRTLGNVGVNATCEHVYFCDSIFLCTCTKIIVCGNIYAYYRQDERMIDKTQCNNGATD